MSEVRLSVGGRTYTVRCEDGQEDHIRKLAGVVDGKIGSMGKNRSSFEAKNMLFAALLLADELDEKRAAAAQVSDDGTASRLENIAEALEKVADRLEADPSGS